MEFRVSKIYGDYSFCDLFPNLSVLTVECCDDKAILGKFFILVDLFHEIFSFLFPK